MIIMRSPSGPQGREHGAAQIEFLISIVTFLITIFWTFEISMLIYTYVVMGAAAKAGVRYAIVHGKLSGSCQGPSTGCDATAANVKSIVNSYAALSLHDTSALTPTVTYVDSTSAAPGRVQVQIQYSYIPYVNFPGFSPTLVASAEGRIVF